MIQNGDDRLGQCHDDGDCGQQAKAQQQRGGNADPAGALLLLFRQFVGEDRDEDQIVDAEHDFHDDQREQRDIGGRVGQKGKHVHDKIPSLTYRRIWVCEDWDSTR